jgi:hypothetical protein
MRPPRARATRPSAADHWDAAHRSASEDEHRDIRDEADLADIER